MSRGPLPPEMPQVRHVRNPSPPHTSQEYQGGSGQGQWPSRPITPFTELNAQAGSAILASTGPENQEIARNSRGPGITWYKLGVSEKDDPLGGQWGARVQMNQ
jgi:hypothetical protein